MYSSLLSRTTIVGKTDLSRRPVCTSLSKVPVVTSHVLCAKHVVHGCHVASRISTSTLDDSWPIKKHIEFRLKLISNVTVGACCTLGPDQVDLNLSTVAGL